MILVRRTPAVALALASLGALALGAATASGASKRASVSIIHVVKGCHVLMVNGASGVVNATVSLGRGGKLSVINNDEQEHRAVQLSGPVKLARLADMNRLGATSQATFAKAGVYRFKFTIGRDFVKGLKIIGEDYQMTMKVIVS